jgi:hypothetical protein
LKIRRGVLEFGERGRERRGEGGMLGRREGRREGEKEGKGGRQEGGKSLSVLYVYRA